MKRIVVALLFVIIAVILGIALWPYQSLVHEIASVDKTLSTNIISIEEMKLNEAPTYKDLDNGTKQYMNLVDEVKRTKLKRKEREEGMEIVGTLYTFSIVSADGAIATITVNDNKQLHINQKNYTYSIRNEDSKLYKLLEQYFE